MLNQPLKYAVMGVATVGLLSTVAAAQQRSGRRDDPAAAAREKIVQAAGAKPTPRTSDGHPDLNGIWLLPGIVSNAFGYGAPPGEVSQDGKEHTVYFDGRGFVGQSPTPNLPAYKTPEFEAKRKQLDSTANHSDPARYSCQETGVPRTGLPDKIVQTPKEVIFLYQQTFETSPPSSSFRVIPTDGRPHRKDVDPSAMGDSVGHWEGDTLVVDVTKIDESTWFCMKGCFHSDAIHVTERLTRKGDTLTYQATVEDPQVLAKAWNSYPVTRILAGADASLPPDVPCVDSDKPYLDDTSRTAPL
jgi:hypothetical protein